MDGLNNLRAFLAQSTIDEETLETKTCWFCGGESAAKEFAEEIALSKNHQVKIGLNSNRHQWEELRRKIPRCLKCKSSHQRTKTLKKSLAVLGGFLGFAAGLILPFYITLKLNIQPTKDFNGIMICSIFGSLIAGALLGYLLGGKIGAAKSGDSKPANFGQQHPVILELVEKGWRVGTHI